MELKLPQNRSFFNNLILQRTDPYNALGGSPHLKEWFDTGNQSQLVDFLLSRNLVAEYINLVIRDMNNELDEIMSTVNPGLLRRVVSIGPGNGLFELLLVSKGFTTDLLLIDIEETPDHRHGFNAQGSGYANLNATMEFIYANSKAASIHLCNPQAQSLPNFSFTFLISLLSMGFHYPCESYIDFIKNQAMKGAGLILDRRKGVRDEGLAILGGEFTTTILSSHEKRERLFLSRL